MIERERSYNPETPRSQPKIEGGVQPGEPQSFIDEIKASYRDAEATVAGIREGSRINAKDSELTSKDGLEWPSKKDKRIYDIMASMPSHEPTVTEKIKDKANDVATFVKDVVKDI